MQPGLLRYQEPVLFLACATKSPEPRCWAEASQPADPVDVALASPDKLQTPNRCSDEPEFNAAFAPPGRLAATEAAKTISAAATVGRTDRRRGQRVLIRLADRMTGTPFRAFAEHTFHPKAGQARNPTFTNMCAPCVQVQHRDCKTLYEHGLDGASLFARNPVNTHSGGRWLNGPIAMTAWCLHPYP